MCLYVGAREELPLDARCMRLIIFVQNHMDGAVRAPRPAGDTVETLIAPRPAPMALSAIPPLRGHCDGAPTTIGAD